MKILDNLSVDIRNKSIRYFTNVNNGIKPFLINELQSRYSKKRILIILDNNDEINYYHSLFIEYFKSNNILKFPSWDNLPYEEVSPSQNILSERFKTLSFEQNDFTYNNSLIILANIESFLQMVPLKKFLKEDSFNLYVNDKCSLQKFNSNLLNAGYEKVSLVLEPYEYAVRGGIIDIWPIGSEYPLRIDFFGDLVESIKSFNPVSQITIQNEKSVNICNSLESPRSKKFNQYFTENYRNLFGPTASEQLFIHKLKNGIRAEGVENWLPLFYSNKLCNIVDFFDAELILADDDFFQKAKKKLEYIFDLYLEKKNLEKKENENFNSSLHPNFLYLSDTELKSIYKSDNFKEFSLFSNSEEKNSINIPCKQNLEFHNSSSSNEEVIERLNLVINSNLGKKKLIITYMSKDEKIKATNLVNKLSFNNFRDTTSSIEQSMNSFDTLDLINIPLKEGFELPLLKVITLNEIFKTQRYAKAKKVRNNLIDIAELHINDLVVHFQHGIGRYLGLKTIKINNSPHDCLIIEYLDNSKLYVPVEDIRLISKFGESKGVITLDKLGSSNWIKRRSSVKNKIRDLASNLIALAAKRAVVKGKNFNIDYNKIAEFSKGFDYQETEDQLATLEEVYRDLSSGKLMDRLVCGDVGFGKTEIALRASAIVVDNNCNVLLIAPTTLLARQHYNTFNKRFYKKEKIKLLDRNTKPTERKEITNNFIKKEIKILISTHAIFSVDLSKANIGLFIIDEEQRFGVSHKEKIKKIKNNVHLLTLTATPIPRTLHMSLLGIKDLSLIKTPPVDRKSVETKILKFDKVIIKNAIFNEKKRAGQIYLIVPKVKDIKNIYQKITNIYPNLNIGVAHGKLNSKELEQVMNNFYNYKIDLLISTTIVEAGLDIPRANTLIVYKSNYFGLSQLHQLRGRIGRSDKKAYAFFTLENNNISSNAVRRLKALQTMDTLGAGMQLANYDLDIRGAGNLLGEEQSGQITQVGIEMYQRLLKECINDLKDVNNQSNTQEIEVSIKLPILIPEKYIPDLSLRLSLYRRVGEINEIDELKSFKEEMINRFGIIPDEFSNYLNVMVLKLLARKCSISKIYVFKKVYSITFDNKRKDYSENFIKWVTNSKNKIILKDSHVIKVSHEIEDAKEQLFDIIDLVKNMLILLES
ncbi:transcription-repair coupling factor [Alphaproteobacteria bacterium]|nr:transcription-repair coupling factor [Alphaproteobacteria bacterium]